MRIAVTGATGFLGWHVLCRAFASGVTAVPVDRSALTSPELLADVLRNVHAVVHCAGVNRGADSDVLDGNLAVARALADAVRRAGQPIRIVYANSVHSRGGTAYGVAKRKAGELLAGAVPGAYSDVVLPNVFGEHGRPYYNSFVATFCRDVADGRPPADVSDRDVVLLHAQDAAGVLEHEAHSTGDRTIEPDGESIRVAEVLDILREFESTYRSGELPDLTGRFRTSLFHTYRSHLFPERFPIELTRRTDSRGTLLECVRTGVTGGQALVSTTVPGAVRGEHVHLRKFERFVVLDGQAEIAMRRLFTDHLVRFQVSGDRPVLVDMPTMWTHNLTSIGERPTTAFFWTNEVFHPDDPDTFACQVDCREGPP
ncbi:polysaccharide biosynthesis C-terminal domain-containing protein [Phytoactinopolyspora halotolerans]|uniref:NAD-dependent epimerase/dehydratase family protein n=1 Tax=Phytoactinopolyspora halotolerans TaxID=1981512 RepID=A0A6L9S6M3_9ACTN|nr:NAD-dependent epimerase/dehydratase family protein [Phytoactinopolyspora halotolerans]NEE00188.1 NAD-dependent epimerase/dehydratase family protein [Phytoactinopolyspora halotolerans]